MRILLYKRRKRKVKKFISIQELEENLQSTKIFEMPIEQKAFSLLENQSFELGKVNQKEDVTFVVLNRVQEDNCVVNPKRVHHTCPSYLMIKDDEVHIGCYACKKMKLIGII